MQTIDTLDDIDKHLSCVFASQGTIDGAFISAIEDGVPEVYATRISEGGSLVTRAMVNSIGMIATTDIFMAKVGCLQTYVNGINYEEYAKLEYVDNSGISHTVFSTRRGLGNFNSDSSLVSSQGWKIADNPVVELVSNFN